MGVGLNDLYNLERSYTQPGMGKLSLVDTNDLSGLGATEGPGTGVGKVERKGASNSCIAILR